MYSFIANLILFASLAFIIYLLARALPRISDAEHEAVGVGAFDKMLDRLPMERIDVALSTYLEKLLRKFKIFVSKLDAIINSHLAKVRKNSPLHKGKEGIILKEKMEAMVEAVKSEDEK